MSLISLDIVTNKVIIRDELNHDQYGRIFDIVCDGYTQLFRKYLPDYKTVFVKWDDNDRRFIKFPKDYDHYILVGVVVKNAQGNNTIMTLSRNDLMCYDKPLPCKCDCERDPSTATVSSDLALVSGGGSPFNQLWFFGRGYRDGQYVGELYGMGGGLSYKGCFTEDWENKRFVFGSDVPMDTEICIRYKPTGIDYDGQSVKAVPELAQEALIAWGQWKRLNLRNSNMGERAEAEYQYLLKAGEMSRVLHGMGESEVLDAIFEGLTFTISR